MNLLKQAFALLRETFQEWNDDKAPRLAAALAYYTVFSIGPLLLIIIAIVGFVLDRGAVQQQLVSQVSGLVGQEGGEMVQELLSSAFDPAASTITAIIGVVTLLLAAAGVLGQLKDALNTAWDAQPPPSKGIMGFIRERFLSFAMILGIGFVLLVSLVISAVLTAIDTWVSGMVPGTETLLRLVSFVVSFGVITLMFALLFKYVPDVRIEWRDVWVGAAFTAVLFNLGKWALGMYLGGGGAASAYGSAGALVLIMLWVYYSAQILLFGAEFTQVYARRYGSHSEAVPAPKAAEPPANAQPVPSRQAEPERQPQPARAAAATSGERINPLLALVSLVVIFISVRVFGRQPADTPSRIAE